MIKILEHRKPTARTSHVCDHCYQVIKKGEQYHNYVIIDEDNKMVHYKKHNDCKKFEHDESEVNDEKILTQNFDMAVREFLYEKYMPQMNRVDIEHLIDLEMTDRDRIETMNLILEEKNDK